METSKIFQYFVTQNYGSPAMYPATKESAIAMAWLRPGQKTVSHGDIRGLEFFGYSSVEVLESGAELKR